MDNELKTLKDHLNRTVYRGQRFTEKNKMDIRQRIHQTNTQPSYNRFKSTLSVIVCFAMLIALGTFAWKQMSSPNTAAPSSQGQSQNKTSAIAGSIKPFSFIYAQHSQKGNLDSVIVAAVNPDQKRVMLLSLPPNYQVKSGNYGVAEDLQSAFSEGKLRSAVSNLLDVPIQGMTVMTDDAFKRTVDMVNGVHVTSPLAFNYIGEDIKKGEMTLDGNEALAYFTMIKSDPNGEMGRMQRQQEVVESLLERVSITSLQKYIGDHKSIKSSDPFPENVIKDQKANDYQFESLKLNLKPKTEDAIFYYVAGSKDIQVITEKMKEQLK